MKYIECPTNYIQLFQFPEKTLFLGGGISNCPDWQAELVQKLSISPRFDSLVIFNPRRSTFDVTNPTESIFQINWEYQHLRIAQARLFWFPKESICPITLFELGKFIEKSEPLFVGCDLKYSRRIDLEQQMRHARPNDSSVYNSLDYIIHCIDNWLNL